MKKSKFSITDDDFKLLTNLWRWKILTTSMIHSSAYSHRSLSACYKRLNRLECYKYIESFSSRDAKRWFWQLTDKGYRVLNFDESEIKQNGFKSEHKDHDFLVTLFHFGIEQTLLLNSNSAIYTEQELRRIEIENYPDWVPHTKQHRPDGYFKLDRSLSNDKSLVAIEVELNLKSAQKYFDLGQFYSDTLAIHQVLWLVKTETDAQFILNNLKKGSSQKETEHSFIILSQWFDQLWQTKIFIGKKQNQNIEFVIGTIQEPSTGSVPDKVLFEFRKKLINSTVITNQTKSLINLSKIIG